MTGFPQETLYDFNQTINIFKNMLKINPDVSIRLFAFTPYPKVPLLEENPGLAKYLPDTIEDWAKLTYQDYIPPWLKPKHKKLINNIVWMTNFLSRKQRPKTSNPLINIILYLYHLSAVFRLNHNLLFFTFEWKIFKWAYKINMKLMQKKLVRWLS